LLDRIVFVDLLIGGNGLHLFVVVENGFALSSTSVTGSMRELTLAAGHISRVRL